MNKTHAFNNFIKQTSIVSNKPRSENTPKVSEERREKTCRSKINTWSELGGVGKMYQVG